MDTFWSRTLDRLKAEGWSQGTYSGGTGMGVCLGQAIFRQYGYEAGDWDLFDGLTREVADHLGAKGRWPDPVSRIIYWNDDPTRTFVDVERLLTELHEKALAQGGELA